MRCGTLLDSYMTWHGHQMETGFPQVCKKCYRLICLSISRLTHRKGKVNIVTVFVFHLWIWIQVLGVASSWRNLVIGVASRYKSGYIFLARFSWQLFGYMQCVGWEISDQLQPWCCCCASMMVRHTLPYLVNVLPTPWYLLVTCSLFVKPETGQGEAVKACFRLWSSK